MTLAGIALPCLSILSQAFKHLRAEKSSTKGDGYSTRVHASALPYLPASTASICRAIPTVLTVTLHS